MTEAFQAGEIDNAIESFANLLSRQPEHRSVEKNVVSSGELRVKSSADFKQTGKPAVNLYGTGGGLSNPRKDFQEGRFTGAIFTDNCQRLALGNLKGDVSQSPEIARRFLFHGGLPAYQMAQPSDHLRGDIFKKGPLIAFAQEKSL